MEQYPPAPKRRRGRPTKEEAAQRKAMEQAAVQHASQSQQVAAEVNVNGSLVWALLEQGIEAKVKEAVTDGTTSAVNDLVSYVDAIKEEVRGFERTFVVREVTGLKERIEGRVHQMFETLLRVSQVGPVMMVGPAGGGRTFAAEQVAKSLDVPFYSISVGSQTSKSDLVGYMSANGDYVSTQFRQAVENGGLFLMDEIDAGNPNVLVVLNSVLSGTACAFPDGMVNVHEKFLFFSTANTFGTGANRQYVGRNQLDSATLDRFITINWDYDTQLEAQLVSHLTHNTSWLKVINALRKLVNDRGLRVIVSPRATIQGCELLELGFSMEDVVRMKILPTAPEDTHTAILDTAHSAWGSWK